jgi:hypothetical protein
MNERSSNTIRPVPGRTCTRRARHGVAWSLLAAVLALPPATALAADGAAPQFDVRLEPPSRRLVVSRGAQVAIRWHTDEAGELHVHGYDVAVPLDPRAPVVTRFEARATGRFPVTSHGFAGEAAHGHGALLWIEVHPD